MAQRWRSFIVEVIADKTDFMTALHQITPDMAVAYKAVRLRALKDSPSAFGSTYLRESEFTDEQWDARAVNLDGERRVGYLAFDDGQYCGIAVCFVLEEDSLKADVVSMWVAPEYRKAGVGRLLVDAIVGWAGGRGVKGLQLMVTSCNDAAIEFYKRLGFSMTGYTEPYPNDPALVEYQMIKGL
jgi:ribosomal protein S18 acetylase RimI-like enzyme